MHGRYGHVVDPAVLTTKQVEFLSIRSHRGSGSFENKTESYFSYQICMFWPSKLNISVEKTEFVNARAIIWYLTYSTINTVPFATRWCTWTQTSVLIKDFSVFTNRSRQSGSLNISTRPHDMFLFSFHKTSHFTMAVFPIH